MKQVIIRSFDPITDLDFFEKMYNDFETMYFIPLKKEIWTKDELVQRFTNQLPNKRLFVVEDVNSNQIIGEAGIYDYLSEPNQFELGYILYRSFWNMGYGKALCNYLIHKVFNEYNGEKVICRVDDTNLGSKLVSEANNMVVEKTEKLENDILLLVYSIDK